MNKTSPAPETESGKGRRRAVVWLLLLAAVFFILLVVALCLPGGPSRLAEWIPVGLFLFVVSFAVATALVGVWVVGSRLGCRRNLKRLGLAGAALAALIGLFYGEENWRGWQAWKSFQRQAERKGEHLTLASVVPPPVPAAENFALTPIAFSSYGFVLTREGKAIPGDQRDEHFVARMRMPLTLAYPEPTNCAGDWAQGVFTRLEGWQSHYRALAARTNEFPVPAQAQSPAADVLLALSRYDGVIEELRAANQLPSCRFPLNYGCEPPWNIMLPHLGALKGCARVLQLRSVAELQNGQSDHALEDVRLGLQLADKIRTEPLLISHLVRGAMVQLLLQPIWEGLAHHQWTEAQLAALEAELAQPDFPAAWRVSMHGELAALSDSMQYLRCHRDKLRELEVLTDFKGQKLFSGLPGPLVARLIPAGWFYQNQLRGARGIEQYYLPLADAETFSPATAQRAEAAVAAQTATPCNVYERRILPVLGSTAPKFAYAQGAVNLARTALALERWRLAHGEWPESLEALAPQYLAKVPHDVIDGQSLKYRRQADGQFLLYSVGWNATDDGGQASLKPDGAVDIETGDWVWRYSPASPK
jgi:hypothetical protein